MYNEILYHASTIKVDSPLTHVGRKELDFGPGFYLTHDRQQAIKWGKTLASRKKNTQAVINIYHFDEALFLTAEYRKTIFSEYNIEWLDFVAHSRKGLQPWKEFDWIEGGIANDRVISTVDAYIDGFITAEQALGQLINEELSHQVCISNQQIIDNYLHYINSETH